MSTKKTNERVRVFTNGSDFMDWQEHNCEECFYADLSDDIGDKTCRLEYEISLSSVTDGLIPLWVCKEIGYKDNNTLHNPCMKKMKDVRGDNNAIS